MWMVRAEVGGKLFEEFKTRSLVAMGWAGMGDSSALQTREDFKAAMGRALPTAKPGQQIAAASQLYRFVREIGIGDRVVTYDPAGRKYLIGTFTGAYRYDPSVFPSDPDTRSVQWDGEVKRDDLSIGARNKLGSISTLFLVPESATAELAALLVGAPRPIRVADATEEAEESDDFELLFRSQLSRAKEFVKDKLNELSWSQMQELVAGVLRAMGYKTQVSPSGADRGKDIIASPDGFGFEDPRIVVEVKHRTSAMGAQEIRSFLGGRHKDDKGLYVSTGGFTKDALYEAERATIRVTLMDSDDLVDAVLAYYDALDNETQRLLPLRRIYWPVAI